MDNKLYTAVLKYETEGIQLTTRQIKELDDHIAELARTAGTSDDEINKLQKTLDNARASLKGFQNGIKGVSGDFKDLITDTRILEKAFQGLNRQDVLNGGSGKGLDIGANLADLERVHAVYNGLNRTLPQVAKEYVNLTNAEAKATDKSSRANRVLELERELAALTPLEAATRRVKDAQEQLDAVQKNISAETDLAKRVDLRREEEQAINRLKSAEQGLRSEVGKAKTEELRAHNAALKEQERLTNAVAKSNRDMLAAEGKLRGQSRANEVGDISAALERQEDATKRLAQARKELAAAQQPGNLQALDTAQRNVTSSANELYQANEQVNRAVDTSIQQLPRMRYALYDISQTAAIAGAALTAVGIGSTAMAASMEADFANVVRTTGVYLDSTGTEVRNLRAEFDELYRSMPASWSDITDIGTLAGQLNVASEDVAEFTKLVQQFSTTTDVSVEASATAFGRLAALLKVPAAEFANLGSSILEVGVNSIATESEIIAISQQIAGIANTAGLSADEVFGLSSALASIGVAPELSRSLVTRLFTNIMNAVSNGGERLEAFGRLSGMTASQFAEAWGNDATGAILALMQGIGSLEQSKAFDALAEIGVNSIRDQPQVLKLAQNYDLLAESLDYAAQGYANGTALQDQYGVISDTVSAKTTVLVNNIKSLVASMGMAEGVIKGVLDVATSLVQSWQRIVDTPVVGEFAQIAAGGSLLLGVILLLVGGATRMTASWLGAKQVIRENAAQMNVFADSSQYATATLWQQIQAMNVLAKTGRQAAIENGKVVASNSLVASSSNIATGATRGLTLALRTLGIASGIGLVVTAIGLVAEGLNNAKSEAEALLGPIDNFKSALEMDNASGYGGEVFSELTVLMYDNVDASASWRSAMSQIWGSLDTTGDAVDGVTQKVNEYTVAIGENTLKALASSIAQNEEFRKSLSDNAETFAELGFNVESYLQALAKGDGAAYISGLRDELTELIRVQAEVVNQSIQTTGRPGEGLVEIERLQGMATLFDQLSAAASGFSKEIETAAWESFAFDAMTGVLGEGLNELNGELESTSDTVNEFLASFSGGVDDIYATQGAISDLIGSLYENGPAMDAFSEEGRANFSALQSAVTQMADASAGDATAFGHNLANMFAQVEGAGYNLGTEVDYLRQMMVTTFGTAYGVALDTSDANGSIDVFLQNVIVALRARAELERSTFKLPDVSEGAGARASAANQFANSQAQIQNQIASVEQLRGSLATAQQQGQNTANTLANGANRAGNAAKNAGNKGKKAAKDTKKEVRTLIDYANDLSAVWDRAFDIRFAGQATFDDITSSWYDIGEAFADAEDKIRDLRIELQGLNSDVTTLQAEMSQQQYFLSIAVEYGDDKRAEQIRARLTELSAELADKQSEVTDTAKELDKAQQDASKTLTGNSEAAIRNRDDLANLVKTYQAHIGALAESGASQDELKQRTAQLRDEFVRQATQLGYSRTDVEKYAAAFDDVTVAINNVPRNITVNANTNPATQALNEWLASNASRSLSVALTASGGGLSGGSYRPSSISSSGPLYVPSIENRGPTSTTRIYASQLEVAGPGKMYWTAKAAGGAVPQRGEYHASGGVAGLHPGRARGTDTVPAWLTPDEYVVNRAAHRYYGTGFMDAVNEQRLPRYFSQGSAVSSSDIRALSATLGRGNSGATGVVSLTAGTIQAIARAVQPHLFLDGKQVAQSTARANAVGTAVGSH